MVERGLQNVGRPCHIEGIDPECAATVQCELLPRPGQVGQDEHAVGRVEQWPLLGDEVEPVADRVDQQHVR